MREEDYFTTINVPIGFWIRGTPAAKPKAKKPAAAAAAESKSRKMVPQET
ncbi:unnamed protein product [Dibothriocephalus latus]|uniref:Uncharacterized protein n=1 Tax=Dibothriocephalus latus TaxID=60516 RepID=A0A3P7N144_DIBLA|nr:unnamed protein product [Dibothriocephalus latus]